METTTQRRDIDRTDAIGRDRAIAEELRHAPTLVISSPVSMAAAQAKEAPVRGLRAVTSRPARCATRRRNGKPANWNRPQRQSAVSFWLRGGLMPLRIE